MRHHLVRSADSRQPQRFGNVEPGRQVGHYDRLKRLVMSVHDGELQCVDLQCFVEPSCTIHAQQRPDHLGSIVHRAKVQWREVINGVQQQAVWLEVREQSVEGDGVVVSNRTNELFFDCDERMLVRIRCTAGAGSLHEPITHCISTRCAREPENEQTGDEREEVCKSHEYT